MVCRDISGDCIPHANMIKAITRRSKESHGRDHVRLQQIKRLFGCVHRAHPKQTAAPIANEGFELRALSCRSSWRFRC